MRVLDGLLERRDKRRVLLREEVLRNCIARLALTADLTVQQVALHIRITTTPTHKRNGEEGACLCTNVAAVDLEARLVLQNALGIDVTIIGTETLARLDHHAIHRQRIDLLVQRNKVGCGVLTRTHRLFRVLLDTAKVIARMS